MHSLIPRTLEITALIAAVGLLQLWAGAAAEPRGQREVESLASIIEYVIPRVGAAPYSVAVNRFGVAWYVDQANSRIGRVDPETGEIKDFEMPSPGAAPHGIAIGRRGRIWYSATKLGRIGVLDTGSGKIMEYPLPPGVKDPDTLLIHKNRIWFSAQRANVCGYLNRQSSTVVVLPVPTPNARPHDLAAAPDGGIWVTLFGTHRLARGRRYKMPRPLSRKSSECPPPSPRRSSKCWSIGRCLPTSACRIPESASCGSAC